MGGHLPKMQKKDVRVDDVCNELDKLSLKTRSNSDEQETEPKNPLVEEKDSAVEESENSATSDGSDNEAGDQEINEDSGGPEMMELPLESAAHEIIAYQAKLYRFDKATHEWKERGVGKMRIFEPVLQEGRLQVVMWVNGTGRLACNFRIGSNMNVRKDPGKPKTATWTAFDFAEEKDGRQEILCCRFSSAAECDDFIAKLTLPENQPPPADAIKTETKESPPADAIKTETEESPPADAIKTETEESPVDCTGCIGCEPDDFNFPTIEVIGKIEAVIESQLESDSCSDIPSMVKPTLFN